MPVSVNNIQFNYLYRDAGNYKLFGYEVFSNPEGIPIREIETTITANLIDGEYFDPLKWEVKPLTFSEWDDDLDHFWNEFESIEATPTPVTSKKSLKEFLDTIKKND